MEKKAKMEEEEEKEQKGELEEKQEGDGEEEEEKEEYFHIYLVSFGQRRPHKAPGMPPLISLWSSLHYDSIFFGSQE